MQHSANVNRALIIKMQPIVLGECSNNKNNRLLSINAVMPKEDKQGGKAGTATVIGSGILIPAFC